MTTPAASPWPRLQYLLDCYYHQDWMHDVPSGQEVALWQQFAEEESPEILNDLTGELEQLLTYTPEDGLAVLNSFEPAGRYWSGAHEAREWLEALAGFLGGVR